MKTILEVKRDLDPMLLANMVMEDPDHKARVIAKTERARKCYQSKAERELQAVKAQQARERQTFQAKQEKERRSFQEYVTQMAIDHNATTAAIFAGALLGGYILALI